jgi:hypothetical protein
MDIVTEKYVRKPLVVDAVQVTAENFEAIADWCQGEIVNNDGTEVTKVNPGGQHVRVRVHNPKTPRQTKAYVGDWILYTDRGYKIYTIRAFEASFDPTEGGNGVQAVTKQVG